MASLAIAFLLQAPFIGPPNLPEGAKIAKPEAAKECEDAKTDEIVVCAQDQKGTVVTNQFVTRLKPPHSDSVSTSENGLMQYKIGKNVALDGGGPKNSAGVGVRIRF